MAGGGCPSATANNQYITISTLGNSAAFGDSTTSATGGAGMGGNAIRGIGWKSTNVIEFVTIATLGNAIDFGDANVNGFNGGGVCSSPTRSVAGGGYNNSSNQNWMSYVQIMSTGNAVDFGDLPRNISSVGGISNGHGGL